MMAVQWKSRKWDVNYDGWFVVEADTKEKAYEMANHVLSGSRLINDGVKGEWYLLNAMEEEDE